MKSVTRNLKRRLFFFEFANILNLKEKQFKKVQFLQMHQERSYFYLLLLKKHVKHVKDF